MLLIADFVLLVHFCIVIFISFGFFLIPVGYNFDWIWIKKRPLRLLHAGMMSFITFETLLGMICPLTIIENSLRGINENHSFISMWVGQIIYWDLPSKFFVILYCILLLWTFLMWKIYPPVKKCLK